ncbi:MAG: UbiA family prenyltransferase, partial [Proteobacteria bacterium]|nr:UbiA family prenyltransferase [Pseudomonadota bacterium]
MTSRAWPLVRAAIELMRPLHWVKNGFVLTGLLFSHAWNDAAVLAAVLGATAAFCLASSAVYAFNDSMDADADLRHPRKRLRPVARGAISMPGARVLAAATGVAALALSAATAPGTLPW